MMPSWLALLCTGRRVCIRRTAEGKPAFLGKSPKNGDHAKPPLHPPHYNGGFVMRSPCHLWRIIGHHAHVLIENIGVPRPAESDAGDHVARLRDGEPRKAHLVDGRHECPDP